MADERWVTVSTGDMSRLDDVETAVSALETKASENETLTVLKYTVAQANGGSGGYNRWIDPFPIDASVPHHGVPARYPLFSNVKLGSMTLMGDTEAVNSWTNGNVVVKVYKESAPFNPNNPPQDAGQLIHTFQFGPPTTSDLCNNGKDGDDQDRSRPNFWLKLSPGNTPILIDKDYNIQLSFDATQTNFSLVEAHVWLELKRPS